MRSSAHLYDDGLVTWMPGGEPVELERELVLRGLQDLDTNSPDAVVAFVNRHGELRRHFTLFGVNLKAANFDPPFEPPRESPNWNHILDVALYLRTMRALVNHWLNYLEGIDVGLAWSAEASPVLKTRFRATPWERFAEAMSAGLDAYRVRVEYTVPLRSGRSFTEHAPQPDLFSAMCLQLFNIMCEALPVRRCANETCGRRFVRQLGRAEYGQYRTEGVRFCSKTCAKAQVQREYRRRQKKGHQ